MGETVSLCGSRCAHGELPCAVRARRPLPHLPATGTCGAGHYGLVLQLKNLSPGMSTWETIWMTAAPFNPTITSVTCGRE